MSETNQIELKLRVESLEKWKSAHTLTYEQERKELNHKLLEVLGAVGENTKAIHQLTEETRDILSLYRDAQGVFRIGKGIQDIVITVTKFGAIGALVMIIFKAFKTYFPHLF